MRMGSVGICGTDIHNWLDGGWGKHRLESPLVLGHEGSGTVSKLGEGVKQLEVGQSLICFKIMVGFYMLMLAFIFLVELGAIQCASN